MQWTRFWASMLGLAFLFLTLATVGCGGSTTDDDDEDLLTPMGGGGGVAKTRKPIPPGTATIKGRVTLSGSKPNLAAMDTSINELLMKHADSDRCFAKAPADDKGQQLWRFGKDNGVADVVIFLTPTEFGATFFSCDEETPGVKKAKEKNAEIDQPYCAFDKRALVLFPSYRDKNYKVQSTGQILVVKNSATIAHNTDVKGGLKQPKTNITIGPTKDLKIDNLKPDISPVSISCTIHSWMRANLWVLDHPYFAVTDKDGNYTIENVPEGKVNITAWHGGAKNNFLVAGGFRGETIETKKGETTTKNFTVTAE